MSPVGRVIFDLSVSVDGFATATGITPEEPLGLGGQRLHEWATGGDDIRVPAGIETVGALITGRRTYTSSLPWWGADGPHSPRPVFVVTHEPDSDAPVDSVYHFVTGGIEDALAEARQAAGERNVRVMGGASLGQQYLAAGLIDELVVHVAPVLLGDGQRMFEGLGEHLQLEQLNAVPAGGATHLHYRVVQGSRP